MFKRTLKGGIAAVTLCAALWFPSVSFAVVNTLNVPGVDPQALRGGTIRFPNGEVAAVKRAEDCKKERLGNDDEDCPKAGFYFVSEGHLPPETGTMAEVEVVLELEDDTSVTGFLTRGADGFFFTPVERTPQLALPGTPEDRKPEDRKFRPWVEIGAAYLKKPPTTAFRWEQGGVIQGEAPVYFKNHGHNAAFSAGVDELSPLELMYLSFLGLDNIGINGHVNFYRDEDSTFIPEVATVGYDFGVPSPAGDPNGIGAGYLFSGAFNNSLMDIRARSTQRILGGGVGVTGSRPLANGGTLDIGVGVDVTNYRMKEDLSLAIPTFLVDIEQHTEYDDTAFSPNLKFGLTSPKSSGGFRVFGLAGVSADVNVIDIKQTVGVSQNGSLVGAPESGKSSETNVTLGYNFGVGIRGEVAGRQTEVSLNHSGGKLPVAVTNGIVPVHAMMKHYNQTAVGAKIRF